MGNCCSGQTVDNNNVYGTVQTLNTAELSRKFSARQLACLIRVQAVIRGYLTRKKIRVLQYDQGLMGLDAEFY